MSKLVKSYVGPKYDSIIAAAKVAWPAMTDKTKLKLTTREVGVDLQNNPIVIDIPVLNLHMEFRPKPLLDEFDADYSAHGDTLLITKRVPN